MVGSLVFFRPRWLCALLLSACAVYEGPPQGSPGALHDAPSPSSTGPRSDGGAVTGGRAGAFAGGGPTDDQAGRSGVSGSGSPGPAGGGSSGAGGSGNGDGATAGRDAGDAGASVAGGASAGVGGLPNGGVAGREGQAGAASSSGGLGGLGGSAGMDGAAGGAGAPTVDLCPDDPNKLAPGYCGCGVADEPGTALADCRTLRSLLAHRYDFEGSGVVVRDSVGQAHGVIARGATLSKLEGKGVVLLGGGELGAYVDLPNGLISSLTSASLEAWITWGGGRLWQRIFDFGSSTALPPENNALLGKSYLFLTPSSGEGVLSAAYSTEGYGPGKETTVRSAAPLPQSLSQVVLVVDAVAGELALYLNGAAIGRTPWSGALARLDDVNVWLGRSQFGPDPELSAVYHEFRVYRAALTAPQVASAFRGGPDPQFFAR
jgi:Concanavalin A-like lectin/glucanases superfamily